MILIEPQNYWIKLLDGGSYRLSTDSGTCKFSKPATLRGTAKLYTLSNSGSLIYVGIAQQPMSARLNYGLKAKGKAGYHGYKWKHLKQRLRLSIWTIKKYGSSNPIKELETVEAEVAFLCRQRSGRWPLYQHEIHFHTSKESHRRAAEHIYNHTVIEHA